MIVKIVTVFLVAIAVLAMFGRLRFPGQEQLAKLTRPKKCGACGRPRIGKGPCPCGAGS
ncbi:MAG: hypothetical protein AAF092_14235 [Pseudomonadota bacterium]